MYNLSTKIYNFCAQSEISPQERFPPQTRRQISAINSFSANSVPVLQSALSIYRTNRKESAKRLLAQNSGSVNSDGRGETFVKVVYQKFNGQFTLACGSVLDT